MKTRQLSLRPSVRDMIRVQISAIVAATLVCGTAVRAQDVTLPRATSAPSAQPNPLMRLSLDQLSATRERPLFAPTRRPPPPPPATVGSADPLPPPPPDPPTLSLFGIVKDTDGASALVRAQTSDKVQRLRVGDKLQGWEVARIEERQLVLELEDRSTTFTLFSRQPADEQPQVAHHRAAPVVELNAAGILTARRVSRTHR
jgi:general secretion pathway protein N